MSYHCTVDYDCIFDFVKFFNLKVKNDVVCNSRTGRGETSEMVSKRLGRITWLLFLSHIWIAKGWDTDDLELFDLVEEVNRNFYEVLGVDQVLSQI